MATYLSKDLVVDEEKFNTAAQDMRALKELTNKLPRVRNYREKTNRSAIRSMTEEKRKAREELIAWQKKDWKKIKELEKDGKIDFAELPVIEPRMREILLKWLSDGLEDMEYVSRTEEGRKYKIEVPQKGEKCILHCEDGNLTMPRFVIAFEEKTL